MLAARHRARLAMEEGAADIRTPKNRNVRRRLFVDDNEGSNGDNQPGSIENEANRFVEETRANMQTAKERWNFDFEKEEPLPGRYEWVKGDQDFPETDSLVEKENEKSLILTETNENNS